VTQDGQSFAENGLRGNDPGIAARIVEQAELVQL